MYTSATMDATAAALSGGTLGTANTTQMCLSCHDGTVTLGNLYNGPNGGAASTASVTGNALFGTDLSNDHPINIDYDTALSGTDGELYDPATNAATAALLDSGQVQCASWLDPHNVTAGEQPFLSMNNTNSALCATCHIK
jgi:cytochrome c553